ncbi:hypothetical protein [Providencia manganoxydans]|uniref:hypothetical protein n=1 Tax=Providencia manganoxydans TaxID=2923283 RepID=UPI0034E5BA29
MTNRTKINLLIRLITLTTGLVIGGGVSASVIEVNAETFPVIGHAPEVKDVKFDNTAPAVNDTVTAIPDITDDDHDTPVESLYQWQLNGVDISKATQNSYKLVPGDGNGKKLTVKVTPQTDPAITEPAIGTEFTSPAITTQGFAPEALNVTFDGIPLPGQLLTGHYRYYDGDNDPEDTSGTSFEWICSSLGNKKILATTQTYTLQKTDVGCAMSFNVTPRSKSGTPNTGVQVQSKKVVNVTDSIPSPTIRIFNGSQIGDRSGSGFNVEIEYDRNYGPMKSISLREDEHQDYFPVVNHPAKGYRIGETTSSGSIVSDDGKTIKFGDNSQSKKGRSISVMGYFYFQNGPMVLSGSSRIKTQ